MKNNFRLSAKQDSKKRKQDQLPRKRSRRNKEVISDEDQRDDSENDSENDPEADGHRGRKRQTDEAISSSSHRCSFSGCHKEFSTREQLRKHERTHGDKKHSCPVSFYYYYYLFFLL